MRGQMDPEVDALLRAGDIEGAARRAMDKGLHRRAAELLALLGRHAEAAVVALRSGAPLGYTEAFGNPSLRARIARQSFGYLR